MRLKVEFELAGTLWYNTRRLSSSYKNADEFSHWKSSCCSWGTFTVTMGFIQTFWVLQNWHYSCLFGGKLAERLLTLVSKSGHLVIWSNPLLCHPSLAILIQWENSALNHQLYHVNLKLFLYIFLLPMVFFSQSDFVTHFKINFVLCMYYSELKMTVLSKHVFF